MQKTRISPLMLLGFFVLVVAMAGVGWWLSAPPAPEVAVAKVTEAPKAKPTPKPQDTAPPSLATTSPDTASTQPAAPMPVAPQQPNQPPDRDQQLREAADFKIGTILAETNGVDATRDKLLLLFPGMTPHEKVAAAPHLVNLVMDPELPRLLPYLKNNTTPVEAMETIFNDMLNRPPQVGWPVLVDLAGNPRHPFSARAKELLTTIVGEDFGTDVFAWNRGIRAQMERQGIEFDANGNPINPSDEAPNAASTQK